MQFTFPLLFCDIMNLLIDKLSIRCSVPHLVYKMKFLDRLDCTVKIQS